MPDSEIQSAVSHVGIGWAVRGKAPIHDSAEPFACPEQIEVLVVVVYKVRRVRRRRR